MLQRCPRIVIRFYNTFANYETLQEG
jgi:hypothetical protein